MCAAGTPMDFADWDRNKSITLLDFEVCVEGTEATLHFLEKM